MKELFDRSRGGTTPEAVAAAKRRLRIAGIAVLVRILTASSSWLHQSATAAISNQQSAKTTIRLNAGRWARTRAATTGSSMLKVQLLSSAAKAPTIAHPGEDLG